jgi:hypothetical protein
VALVRTVVSEELKASFIRVTRIGEPGTTLAVFLRSVRRLLVTRYLKKTPLVLVRKRNIPIERLPLVGEF